MISFFLQTFWMYVLAGLGGKGQKSDTTKNAIVAAFMLFGCSYSVSFLIRKIHTCTISYMVAEID